MTEVERLVVEYFSSLGPLARKIMQDQELVRSMYGAEWEQMTFEQRDAVIDEYVMNSEILERYKDYSRWEDPPEYFPKLKLGSGEKIIVDDDFRTWQDEHSGPFCWETKSQLDMPLFETEEDRKKAEKSKKRRPRSPDVMKKIEFPWKPEKSIWNSPFLAADRGFESGYTSSQLSELSKTPEEAEHNESEHGGSEASPDSGVNEGSPDDQVMASPSSPDQSTIAEEANELFQQFHISFGSKEGENSPSFGRKPQTPPEPFGDTESTKKSEESSPAYSPVGSPVTSVRETKPLMSNSPKTIRNTKPPPVPLATKPKKKIEPECDDSYEFVEVNRNNNFMVSNMGSSTEDSPIRSFKKDETTALLSTTRNTDPAPPRAGPKPTRKKHNSNGSNSSCAALLPEDSPFKTALSNSVVTKQPTAADNTYDDYEPELCDNKKKQEDNAMMKADSAMKTGFDFLDNW